MIQHIFDVDGTLTPARQPMVAEFAEFFIDFCAANNVYLCSGSDIDKIKEQIPKRVMLLLRGIFPCAGNQYWEKDELESEETFDPSRELVEDLFAILEISVFPFRRGNHLENRPGMLNFSTVGRNCSLKDRQAYKEWDALYGERLKVVKFLSRKYPQLDFSIGGQISIDICPKGKDKGQIIRKLKQMKENQTIYYYGDRLFEGGNDFAVKRELEDADKAFPVKDYKDTQKLLEEFINGRRK